MGRRFPPQNRNFLFFKDFQLGSAVPNESSSRKKGSGNCSTNRTKLIYLNNVYTIYEFK